MAESDFKLIYPRKRVIRFLVRFLGRPLLHLLFRIMITGRKKFPKQGPLLVVGNHTAAMEVVLLNVFSPWQIEMLGAADTPAEKITETVADLYGVIPLHRGSYDRAALTMALDVLHQKGVIGLFPEGGIWEEGKKKALPGIAWLSYRSGAPVLPIGFNDTTGAINDALKLKRPRLKMAVGDLLAPAKIPQGAPRKPSLQEYANQVIEAVHGLVPEEDYQSEPEIVNERFELDISLINSSGDDVDIPEAYQIQHPADIAKFLHRPAILKIFKVNLELPVDALQILHKKPTPHELLKGLKAVLSYLEDDNPYLLTYRFGVKGGTAMREGLDELHKLINWANQSNLKIYIKPIRHYFSIRENQEKTQILQGQFTSWM
jgi:1-acyl-sn-glycerol-3-phosphate acyltransferase